MRMTKIIILLAFAVFAFACSEKEHEHDMPETEELSGTPENIVATFQAKYPNATDAEWEQDGEEWEVEFELDGVEYEAKFDKNGEWIGTEQEVSESEIPDLIQNTLDGEYTDYVVLEVEKYDSSEGAYFEIKLQKGGEIEEVKLYPNGKIVKQEGTEEEKEHGHSHSDMDND